MRKLTRVIVGFLMISAVFKAVGFAAARAFEGERTASDDDFKLMALMDGRELTSKATSLRTGTAVAAMGGIEIDLRKAELDPGGAHIALKAYMGGIRMMVPATWKVYVDEDSHAGGIEVKTSEEAALGDEAPRLTVEAVTRAGGILIETDE